MSNIILLLSKNKKMLLYISYKPGHFHLSNKNQRLYNFHCYRRYSGKYYNALKHPIRENPTARTGIVESFAIRLVRQKHKNEKKYRNLRNIVSILYMFKI